MTNDYDDCSIFIRCWPSRWHPRRWKFFFFIFVKVFFSVQQKKIFLFLFFLWCHHHQLIHYYYYYRRSNQSSVEKKRTKKMENQKVATAAVVDGPQCTVNHSMMMMMMMVVSRFDIFNFIHIIIIIIRWFFNLKASSIFFSKIFFLSPNEKKYFVFGEKWNEIFHLCQKKERWLSLI